MFVLTTVNDKIEIRVASRNKRDAVIQELKKKYINKLVEDLGLAVHLHEIINIYEYEIRSDILVSDVTFQLIFLRFYSEEVCSGKIIVQDEDKIIVGDSLFRRYEIQAHDLFENSEFCYENGLNSWVWNYKGNRLVFYNGDVVKFKIKKLRYEDTTVEALMNDQGLGPSSWWD